jgi:hypothetical protein
MSIARADLTVIAWDRTKRHHFAGFRHYDEVLVNVDDRNCVEGGLALRGVCFAATVSEVIAKSPCICRIVRPHQHYPAAKK